MAPNFFLISGYTYANNPPVPMCVNDPVIWYLYDMGFDTHVFHMHGENTVDAVTGATSATVVLNPGQMTFVLMTASNPGWWQLLCHFTTHLRAQDSNQTALSHIYSTPFISGTCFWNTPFGPYFLLTPLINLRFSSPYDSSGF
ncbi:hypothetical protein VC83_03303 [Pseudogymnoascus destructans]|uniref:Plastocyanin-like domain-containing protein n=1 Tax=Pseudogymnoascus destructans TaxID=655981 RepID=A0A177AEV6_9PEZI|nr:uncharacterized protein VC83_03303 [Pseudogymnoascus destructans]OAF60638.1 hypothetical protein VC83_03303 [Pseudogymnoascus destructans]